MGNDFFKDHGLVVGTSKWFTGKRSLQYKPSDKSSNPGLCVKVDGEKGLCSAFHNLFRYSMAPRPLHKRRGFWGTCGEVGQVWLKPEVLDTSSLPSTTSVVHILQYGV